jgi:alanine racemase
MNYSHGKVKTVISLGSIVNNYTCVRERSGKEVIPVVKGDAYGHGLVEVAQALGDAGAKTFAVGTVEEGMLLRERNKDCGILSMLGPVESHEFPALWECGITAFIHSFEQLERLARKSRRFSRPLPIAIKFDTGMRRLGFTLSDVPRLASMISDAKKLDVRMLSSHLATADDPDSEEFLKQQVNEFENIRKTMRNLGFDIEANISNSAAALAYPGLGCRQHRVGILLYGVNPLAGTPAAHLCGALEPAMSVKSVVISKHSLKAGQAISYGCTFTAEKDMTVAIVAAGYANGYSRALSNSGEMCIRGKRARIVGRVCLQMAAIDVTAIPKTRVGDDVYLLGGKGKGAIDIYELAKWWKSIPAEVMNAFSVNKREFRHA